MIRRASVALIIVFLCQKAYCGYRDWPCYANTMTRQSIAVDGPNVINTGNIQWIADTSPQGLSKFEFEGAAGAVVYDGKVYACAKYLEPNESAWDGYDQTGSQLIAYDSNSGQILWSTVIDAAVWDSWSSPAIDVKNNTVLIASGSITADGWYILPATIYAVDALTGSIVWTNQLDSAVLNASICIAEGLQYGRAFITDYDGFGSNGKLYCINLDAYGPNNPYQPGQIIWSDTLGSTCGNTPAYKDGVVYVSSNADANSGYGAVYAYDAAANTPVRKWLATNPNFEGFTSGVALIKAGYLYAACYDWAEEVEDNSAFCKIDCNNGNIVWITHTERTSTIPVVVGDKIYISGGFGGYGSRPKVSAFQDLGASVVKLWETPANMVIGGWTNQPVYANGKLYAGAIPLTGDYFGAYTELYILDVNADVNSSDFVIAHYIDQECGNNPAVMYDSIYTIGYDGLLKFYQPAFLADIDKDSKVDFYDLAELAVNWLFDGPIGVNRADLNLDGKINFTDFSLLADSWYGNLD